MSSHTARGSSGASQSPTTRDPQFLKLTKHSPVDVSQSPSKKPTIAVESSLPHILATEDSESEEIKPSDADKIARLEDFIEDLLFSRELTSMEPTNSLTHEGIGKARGDIFQRRIYPGEVARRLKDIQLKANQRVTEWVKRREEITKVNTVKVGLEKALKVLSDLNQSLESAKEDDGVLLLSSQKRKLDEVAEQAEKAAKIMKQMR